MSQPPKVKSTHLPALPEGYTYSVRVEGPGVRLDVGWNGDGYGVTGQTARRSVGRPTDTLHGALTFAAAVARTVSAADAAQMAAADAARESIEALLGAPEPEPPSPVEEVEFVPATPVDVGLAEAS